MIKKYPKKVKAKIIRTVTEIAMVTLDKDGCIDEFIETHEEIESNDIQIIEIKEVLTIHD